jgi:flagellar basal-body rod protein FlgG
MRSLSIGATGMLAQQLNVEVISNNIANITTTGFKRQRAEFQDLLYQNIRRVGSTSSDAGTVVPTGVQIGAGVRTAAVYRINEQGNISVTDNPLDIAIRGRGFFQVELPNGETAYTRSGSFQINADGTVVTADGFTLQQQVQIPQEAVDVTINASGEVLVTLDGQQEPQNVGRIELAVFANEAGLEALGDNLFRDTPASGDAQVGNPGDPGYGRLLQGSLETSNVNMVSEITNLITAQRAYELNSRVIRTTDEMMNAINQLR